MKAKRLAVSVALLAAGVLLLSSEASAGLFDKARPKSKAAVKATPRAQSPDSRNAGYVDEVYGTSSRGSGWVKQTSATYSSGYGDQYGSSRSGYCCECGQATREDYCTRLCRKCCKQTYYCKLPPYCQGPNWGLYPTCWRRLQDVYVCPRHGVSVVEQPAVQPVMQPLPPEEPTQVPPPPDARVAPRSPVSVGARTPLIEGIAPASAGTRAASVQRTAPVDAEYRRPARPAATTWTSFTDTIETDDEADDASDAGLPQEDQVEEAGEVLSEDELTADEELPADDEDDSTVIEE